MIRFAHPLVLVALLGLLALLVTTLRSRKGGLVRFLPAALLLIALAGPQLGQQRPQENVYFLVDRSASVAATTNLESIEDHVAAIVSANPGRRYGAIAFASDAVITDPIGEGSPGFEPGTPLGEATDLAGAVDLALATLPKGGTAQLVVLSDARITDGLDEAIGAAQQNGIPISTLPIGERAERDARLVRLDAPAEVELDRPFAIDIAIAAQHGGEGVLALYRDNDLVAASDVSLIAGITEFRYTDALSRVGAHSYLAIIRQPLDPIPENDGLSLMVHTTEQPQLLVVSRDDPPAISSLLRAIGKSFSVASSVPPLEELAQYRQVVLDGVPLSGLTLKDVETLEIFVGELGGGLVIAEGEDALRGFAGGGIEPLLPVSYTLPEQGRQASLCVVFLLDRSASMRGHAEGGSKIEILKEAAAASINLLDAETLVGVIGFDRYYEWLIPIQPVGEGEAIYEGLRALEAGGGTDIYYPLVDAFDQLEIVEARTRHLLLLSDGKTVDEPRDFPGLLERLQAQEEIDLSAIAIGSAPNLPLLNLLVTAGHGTLYSASDFAVLPEVSMQATQRLSRSRFVSGEILIDGPLAAGALAGIPPLTGYSLTYPKPTSEVLLWTGSDPILARWRVGLGQVAVLNTDLSGEWSGHWLSWEKGGLLVDEILSTAEPTIAPSFGLAATVDIADDGIAALVDARDGQDGFVDFLDVEARLLPTEEAAPMEQIGAGLYRATFSSQPEGGYALRVVDRTREQCTVVPFSIPYPAEYRATGIDKETLQRIARATGGRYLEDEILPDPAPGQEHFTYVDIHPHLLLAALAFFLGELTVRKLPRKWLRLRRGA